MVGWYITLSGEGVLFCIKVATFCSVVIWPKGTLGSNISVAIEESVEGFTNKPYGVSIRKRLA